MNKFNSFLSLAVAVARYSDQYHPVTEMTLENIFNLPKRKLETIMRFLMLNGFVTSVRGHKGGYYLTDAKLTVADLYQVWFRKKEKFDPLMPPLSTYLFDKQIEMQNAMIQEMAKVTIYSLGEQAKELSLPKINEQNLTYFI